MRGLSLFEYRCVCSIGRIWGENFVSKLDVGRKVLGPRV